MNKLSHQIYNYRDKIWSSFMIYTSLEFKKRWSHPKSWDLSKSKNLDITIFLTELVYELVNISVDLIYFLFIFADKNNIIYLKNISYNYLMSKNKTFTQLSKNRIKNTHTKITSTPANLSKIAVYNKLSTINNFKKMDKLNINIPNINIPNNKKYDLVTSSCFTPPESSLDYLWARSKIIDNLDDIDNTGCKYFEYDNYYIDTSIKEHFLNNVYSYLNNNNVISDNNVINNDIDMIFKLDDDDICAY